MEKNIPETPLFEAPKDQPKVPCTLGYCAQGHPNPVFLKLGGCPGCQTQFLGIKQDNCQVCNEPIEKIELRADWVPSAVQITPKCLGAPSLAQQFTITLKGNLKEVEAAYIPRQVVSKI